MANPRQAERDTIEAVTKQPAEPPTRHRRSDEQCQMGRKTRRGPGVKRSGAMPKVSAELGGKAAKRRRGLQSARWTNSPNFSGLGSPRSFGGVAALYLDGGAGAARALGIVDRAVTLAVPPSPRRQR